MHRLAVLEQDDAKGPVFHLLDAPPPMYLSTWPVFFLQRVANRVLDPLVLDDHMVGTRPCVAEVGGSLQCATSYTFSTSSP